MSDDLPPLEDFEDEIKTIQYTKPKTYGEEDYAKPDIRYLDEEEQKEKVAEKEKKIESLIESKKKTEVKAEGFGGFKKGFLSSGPPEKKKEKIPEIKANKNANPLHIPEVQEAMKMNNYLDETRSQWMTDNFLENVTKNPKVAKLFSNPDYMKGIDMFKTNPTEAMAKYGTNK